MGLLRLLNCAVLVLGPLTTLHAPVPTAGVLAARVAEPVLQMAWSLPALAVVGGWLMVTVTLAVLGVQAPLLMVQRSTTGPVPPVCVKVELPLAALLKVPVPPLTTLHAPVPLVGVLPPRLVVVPLAQMVCAPPTLAVEGGAVTVMVTFDVLAGQGLLLIVQRST